MQIAVKNLEGEKMKLQSPVKRAAIFVFYDKDGIVDRYVEYLINNLRKTVETLVVVCNGKLSPKGRVLFEALAEIVYVRENQGLDAAGYREGLVNCLGWENVEQYDEIVLLNDTFYGPFSSFEKIFEEMNDCDIDFWGLTEHYESQGLAGLGKNGIYPDHLQTYFLAIRKKMLCSREFHEYWDNMPVYNSFEQVVGMHEVLFTQHFRDCGFKATAYVELSDLRETIAPNINYYTFAPGSLIKKRKFCVIKRKDFVLEHSELLVHSGGEELRNAMDYVQSETDYDIGMIWENLLRLYELPQLKQALHLNYVLPNYSIKHVDCSNICIIIGCENEELFEEMLSICKDFSKISLIFLTDSSEKKEKIERLMNGEIATVNVYADKKWWKYVEPYEFVCYLHAANVPTIDSNYVSGLSYRYLLRENLLHSLEYLYNVIGTFEENPQLGILAPPFPIHGTYYRTFGKQWDDCLEEAVRVAGSLELTHIPNGQYQPLMIDFSAWYRKAAIKRLIDMEEQYDDRALCRMVPIIAQDAGYYTGCVMTLDYASLAVSNLEYMAEKFAAMWRNTVPANRFAELVAVAKTGQNGIPAIGVKGALKIWLKKHLPERLIAVLKKIKNTL